MNRINGIHKSGKDLFCSFQACSEQQFSSAGRCGMEHHLKRRFIRYHSYRSSSPDKISDFTFCYVKKHVRFQPPGEVFHHP